MNSFFLYPGQIIATQEPSVIKTILGSCVAIVLWDESGHIGGMCHYLLPHSHEGDKASARYGNYAIDELIDRCLKLGARKSSMKAFIYGGGAVVDLLTSQKTSIGEQNIACAKQNLALHDIRIEFESIGGASGRKISFDTANGKVYEEILPAKSKVDLTAIPKAQASSLIKVLIIDDSVTIRNILRSAFDRSKRIQVIGTAVDPYDARDKISLLKPDVITLDIEMPRMNGIEFLEKLMAHLPIPTVVVSSLSAQGSAAVRALELGAVEFVHKPSQFDPTILTEFAEILIPKVLAASVSNLKNSTSLAKTLKKSTSILSSRNKSSSIQAIVIGGNAGSADTLLSVLSLLPQDTPPIVVAISTISGFAESWIQKVNEVKKMPLVLKLAEEHSSLRSGHVYIASKEHVQLEGGSGSLKIKFVKAPPASGQKPSCDILFSSAVQALGESVIGVLLSGYGNDGVSGLLSIKEAGGKTIVQDPTECHFNFNVVSALNEGLADFIESQAFIADRINEIRSEFVS